jgi:hypothetical protein
MMRSVRFEPFKARMTCMEEREKEVVISEIENYICDEVGSNPENETAVNESIKRSSGISPK